MVERYGVAIRRNCVHFETTNCTLSVTSCTFPFDERLQCSSTLKHLTAHAIAHFGLPYAAFNSTSIQTCSSLPHDAHFKVCRHFVDRDAEHSRRCGRLLTSAFVSNQKPFSKEKNLRIFFPALTQLLTWIYVIGMFWMLFSNSRCPFLCTFFV